MSRRLLTISMLLLAILVGYGCHLMDSDSPTLDTEEPDTQESETPEYVALSFNTHGGGEIEPLLNITYGDRATLPTPTRENYVFIGWFLYEQDVEIIIDNNTQILGDWTLHAHWKLKTYEVVFIDYDHKMLSYQTVEHGSAATAPSEPTREGYTFTGWSGDYMDITKDTTIHADYAIRTFTVSFDSRGGSEFPPMVEVEYGSTIVLPEPVKEGYAFEGWYVSADINAVRFTSQTSVTEDVTLLARYEPLTHTVVFRDAYDNSLSVQEIRHGHSAIAPETPLKDGYVFVEWDACFLDVQESMNVRALYERRVVSIVFDTHGGSWIEMLQGEAYSSLEEPHDPVKPGYYFQGWYIDAALSEPFAFDVFPDTDITLHASWIKRLDFDWLRNIRLEGTNFTQHGTLVYEGDVMVDMVYRRDGNFEHFDMFHVYVGEPPFVMDIVIMSVGLQRWTFSYDDAESCFACTLWFGPDYEMFYDMYLSAHAPFQVPELSAYGFVLEGDTYVMTEDYMNFLASSGIVYLAMEITMLDNGIHIYEERLVGGGLQIRDFTYEDIGTTLIDFSFGDICE